MGDCQETLRELEAFLDGEVTEEARVVVHAHLGDCADCLEAFEFHAELRTVISSKCRADQLPPGLAERIRACFGDDIGLT